MIDVDSRGIGRRALCDDDTFVCLRHGVATRAAHSLFNKFAAGERRVSSQFVPELLQCRIFAPLPGHLSHPLKITISDNCPGTLKMRDMKMRETR